MTTVALSPDMEQYVASQLASGAFRSREELLTEALRTLRHRDEQAQKRSALLADLESGTRSLDAGKGVATSAAEILAAVRSSSSR